MATAWTERTIEESGERLRDKVGEARETAGYVETDLESALEVLNEWSTGWYSQRTGPEWDGMTEQLSRVADNLATLVHQMRGVRACVEELQEQGVV
jgi:hypothetical protein